MAKAGGLLLVAWVLVVVLRATRVRDARHRRRLLVAGLGLQLVAVLAFIALLDYEHSDIPAGLNCEVLPGPDDSNYPPSHWSWLPPGEVCEYPTGDAEPTWWRVIAAGALLAPPVVIAAAWRRPADYADA